MTATAEKAPDVTHSGGGVALSAALEGVRLGKRERHLLTHADYMDKPSGLDLGPETEAKLAGLIGAAGAAAGDNRGHFASDITNEVLCQKHGSDNVGGPKLNYWDLVAAVKADMRATRRALRKLERLGLVEVLYSEPIWGQMHKLLKYDLTDLGRLVVDTFRHELETGKRIRWAKLATAAEAGGDGESAGKDEDDD